MMERLNVKLTKEEKGYYQNLYQTVCKDGDIKIEGKEGAAFLKKSGLSKEELKRIWTIAAQTNLSWLEREEFYVALRLVALSQNNLPSDAKSILYNNPIPPLPKFDLKIRNKDNVQNLDNTNNISLIDNSYINSNTSIHNFNNSSNIRNSNNDNNIINWNITNEVIEKYSLIFEKHKDYNNPNVISFQNALNIFTASNVTQEAAAKAIQLVGMQYPNEGFTKKELVSLFHIINKSKSDVNKIPNNLPEQIANYLEKNKLNSDSNSYNVINKEVIQEKSNNFKSYMQTNINSTDFTYDNKKMESNLLNNFIDKDCNNLKDKNNLPNENSNRHLENFYNNNVQKFLNSQKDVLIDNNKALNNQYCKIKENTNMIVDNQKQHLEFYKKELEEQTIILEKISKIMSEKNQEFEDTVKEINIYKNKINVVKNQINDNLKNIFSVQEEINKRKKDLNEYKNEFTNLNDKFKENALINNNKSSFDNKKSIDPIDSNNFDINKINNYNKEISNNNSNFNYNEINTNTTFKDNYNYLDSKTVENVQSNENNFKPNNNNFNKIGIKNNNDNEDSKKNEFNIEAIKNESCPENFNNNFMYPSLNDNNDIFANISHSKKDINIKNTNNNNFNQFESLEFNNNNSSIPISNSIDNIKANNQIKDNNFNNENKFMFSDFNNDNTKNNQNNNTNNENFEINTNNFDGFNDFNFDKINADFNQNQKSGFETNWDDF